MIRSWILQVNSSEFRLFFNYFFNFSYNKFYFPLNWLFELFLSKHALGHQSPFSFSFPVHKMEGESEYSKKFKQIYDPLDQTTEVSIWDPAHAKWDI